MTALAWQRDTVLEILIRLFCNRLAEAVRQGMARRYIAQDDDLPTLRGRLDVTRQFTRNAVSPQILACRFDELSPDIALNQVMRAAIRKLSRLARAPDNQRTLRELSFVYADISEVAPAALRWDLISLDRTNTRWRDLLSLARLFLTDRHQETSSGGSDGHALLFEMNMLFEKYVERMLRRALVGTDFRVSAQGGYKQCLYEGETGRFRTKPDLLVRREGDVVLVVDTKWKRITPRIDDPKQGVSQADVYQLMAYSSLYDCRAVALLYPHHGELPSLPIRHHYAIAAPRSSNTLHVATLDLVGGSAKQIEDLREMTVLAAESLAPAGAGIEATQVLS